jgi:alkanesulfonate monooxygenase SsuD/methylene tetrahydromethanopterin reductase-like flavin-dependent oxidoreductase (luciferase family)
VAITGSAQEVTEGLHQLQGQGAELVLIAPTGDDRPQLEKIVEHVLPALG